MDASYSDNLVVVHRGLERLTAGQTPYAFFQFDTHVQPLPYLPWAVPSYLPPFAAGLDIRLTNILLCAVLVLALIWTVRGLGTPPVTRHGLTLAASVFFVLPIAVGHDAYATWSLFNLATVLAFGLGTLGRARWAAAIFAIARGSRTVAAYLAAPFLAFALRSARGREAAVSLAMLAALATGPMLVLLIWNAEAFLSAVTTAPLKFWAQLDDGSWRHSPFAIVAWYPLRGGRLRMVQAFLGLAFATLAWRHRATPPAGVALAIGSFVSMVFAGPYIAAHMFALPLYLTVLAEAVRANSPEAAERARVTDEARADPVPRSRGR